MSRLGFFDDLKKDGKFYDIANAHNYSKKGLISIFSNISNESYLRNLPGPYLNGLIMMNGEYEQDHYQGNFIPYICKFNNQQECNILLQEIIKNNIKGCENGECWFDGNTSNWYQMYRNYDIRPHNNPNESHNELNNQSNEMRWYDLRDSNIGNYGFIYVCSEYEKNSLSKMQDNVYLMGRIAISTNEIEDGNFVIPRGNPNNDLHASYYDLNWNEIFINIAGCEDGNCFGWGDLFCQLNARDSRCHDFNF